MSDSIDFHNCSIQYIQGFNLARGQTVHKTAQYGIKLERLWISNSGLYTDGQGGLKETIVLQLYKVNTPFKKFSDKIVKHETFNKL